MKDYVDKLVGRVVKRVESEVPEEGKFSDTFELFSNPDKDTSDVVGKYGLHIYKMPEDVLADPKMRYIEACAYIPSAQYKATLMCGSGTKAEITDIVRAPAFSQRLHGTFVKLLDMLQDL